MKNNYEISAKVIADTFSQKNNKRITSLELTMPRFILAQFNTHRAFSRSTASNRAIPVEKMIEQAKNNPVIPVYWGKNKKGMQADEELDDFMQICAEMDWLSAKDVAVTIAQNFIKYGVHKQIANRLLEPFTWAKTIVTATEWDNFFKLRLHEDSQPEMQILAEKMKESLDKSKPKNREIHLPYVEKELINKQIDLSDNWENLRKYNPDLNSNYSKVGIFRDLGMISAARCARVSYLNHDNTNPNIEKDLELAKKLLENGHLSPFEHQAIASNSSIDLRNMSTANFKYWVQLRTLLVN